LAQGNPEYGLLLRRKTIPEALVWVHKISADLAPPIFQVGRSMLLMRFLESLYEILIIEFIDNGSRVLSIVCSDWKVNT
jgi:hypothetical protein